MHDNMKIRTIISYSVLVLFLWSSVGIAENITDGSALAAPVGVWFGIDSIDNSEAWLAFTEKDYVVVDSNAPSACGQVDGAVLVGFAKSYKVQCNTITGTVTYLCQGEPRASFEHMLQYDPLSDQLIGARAIFSRVPDADHDMFVEGVKQLKSMTAEGWYSLKILLQKKPPKK